MKQSKQYVRKSATLWDCLKVTASAIHLTAKIGVSAVCVAKNVAQDKYFQIATTINDAIDQSTVKVEKADRARHYAEAPTQ